VGYVTDKVAPGQVFSENFRFPCRFSFHRLLHTDLLAVIRDLSQSVQLKVGMMSLPITLKFMVRNQPFKPFNIKYVL
jgi:hypothetical protein